MAEPKVRQHFLDQAAACAAMGSAFTARLCRLAALEMSAQDPVDAAVLTWPGDPGTDALALRWCGALHGLVIDGLAPDLARHFPPHETGDAAFWEATRAASAAHRDRLLAWLGSPPQTNEVGRAAILLAGALAIARHTGLRLDWREIGASAGLNLQFDRFGYRAPGWRWGAPGAALVLSPDWRGRPPALDAPLRLASRAGCDQAPINPADPAMRTRLLAYIWPDMPDRLARMRAAISVAAEAPAPVDRMDAADWVARHFCAPTPGRCKVLAHTVMWQYLPAATKTRIEETLAAAGEAATKAAPIARLGFEWARSGEGEIALTLWPGGKTRILGTAHMHAAWVDWRGN